jgi:hypothetical protein
MPIATVLLRIAVVSLLLGGLTAADTAAWPLPLDTVANMGFADAREGDGTGGWSDQGPGNDFHAFDRTRPSYGGVPFSILDPLANQGRAVVTFGCRRFPAGPAEITITLPTPRAAAQLYLLHASCWNGLPSGTPLGQITCTAVDGTRSVVPVRAGIDIADWWQPQALPNGTLGALVTNGESRVGAYVARFATGLNAPLRSITIHGTPQGETIWILLGATLSDTIFTPEPADKPVPWTVTADAHWRPANTSVPQVVAGSALDFSRLVPPTVPTRAVLDGQGHWQADGKPLRLWGASVDLTLLVKRFALARRMDQAPWPDGAALAAYAEAIRLQGYNLVRLGAHDALLMTTAPAADGAGVTFDPRAVAVIDRFVHELRQRGIRLYVDLMGSVSGYQPGSPWTDAAQKADFKRRIFTDPAVRANWQQGVAAFIGHRNPFSGLTLGEDPAVVAVLAYNEQDIPFADLARLATLPEGFAPAWRAWLTAKYGEPQVLARAWGVTKSEPFATIALPDAATLRSGGQRAADLGSFLLAQHRELLAWYSKTASAAGAQAPLTQYDAIPSLFFHALRGEVPVVSMHAYHAHPSAWAQVGSQCAQASAISNLGAYLRLLATCRQFGKPFLVTEYGQVFWNRQRHEEGLMVGGYAALQEWDALMAHQLPVGDIAAPARAYASGNAADPELANLREHPLDHMPIKPFWIAPDPVARASQVISTLAYADRAVRAAPHHVELVADPRRLFVSDAFTAGIPGEQRHLALLTGIGVRVGALDRRPGIDLQIPLAGGAKVQSTDAAAGLVDGPGDATTLVATLRQAGVLPAGNVTDPATGTYESETGELRIERDRQWFSVRTPRLVGGCFTTATTATLDSLNVERITVPGTVALGALDGRPLVDSARLLLIYATDALNSGMTFTTADRTTLVAPGTAPVLIAAGSVTVTIANPRPLHAWALAFTGRRLMELPVTAIPGGLRLTVDQAAMAEPAFFIELAER